MRAVNPATGETIGEYPDHDAEEVERRLSVASAGFEQWAKTPFAERRSHMQRVAELLRQRSSELAVLMAREMGKPVREGNAEIEKCAWAAEFFGERAQSYLSDGPVATDATKSYVAFLPLGV